MTQKNILAALLQPFAEKQHVAILSLVDPKSVLTPKLIRYGYNYYVDHKPVSVRRKRDRP